MVPGIGIEGVEAKRASEGDKAEGACGNTFPGQGWASSPESNEEEQSYGNSPSGGGSRFQKKTGERLRPRGRLGIMVAPLSTPTPSIRTHPYLANVLNHG